MSIYTLYNLFLVQTASDDDHLDFILCLVSGRCTKTISNIKDHNIYSMSKILMKRKMSNSMYPDGGVKVLSYFTMD